MSGSGKSTLSASIAERLGVPHVELDAIFHQPNWTPLDPATFLAEVDRRTQREGWVVDGNYRAVVREGPVWERADTVVWLDLPKATAMRQVTVRSLQRSICRTELWNGNRETLRNLVARDPERSMIRWVWTQYERKNRLFAEALADPAMAHLSVVRLRSHAEASAWLSSFGSASV